MSTTVSTLPSDQLVSGARLLRAAIGLLGVDREERPRFAEMEDFAEVLGIAQKRLETWANDESNEDDERRTDVYVVVDVCQVVSTLIEAGLTSPSIRDTLGLALDRLESVLEAESEEPADPDDQAAAGSEQDAGIAEAA